MKFDSPLRFQPNIRYARAGSTKGYVWGKPAARSNILPTLESGPLERQATRAALTKLGFKEEDVVAERWIVSDDAVHPSNAIIGTEGIQKFTELLGRYAEELLGREHVSVYAPSLGTVMKLIDTNDEPIRGSLSVQVHPARGYESRPHKAEAWKVKEGRLYLGWNRDIDEDLIRAAMPADVRQRGELEGYLNEIDIERDSLIVVPPGVAHAIRYGTFLCEWSRAPPCNNVGNKESLARATVALYDRTDGRRPRDDKEEVEAALDVMRHAQAFKASTRFGTHSVELYADDAGNRRCFLFRMTDVFVEEWTIGSELSLSDLRRGMPFYVEAGKVTIETNAGSFQFGVGAELLVPAAVQRFKVTAHGSQPARLQTWYVPFADELEHIQSKSGKTVPALETLYTERDRKQLIQMGSSIAALKVQLERIRAGPRFARLCAPCTVNDGIRQLDPSVYRRLTSLHREAALMGRLIKFVPASGAATRMFRAAIARLDRLKAGDDREGDDSKLAEEFRLFWNGLEHFAFYPKLVSEMERRGCDLAKAIEKGDELGVLSALLDPDGLDYASLPKAVIEFHRHGTQSRTALEEHLLEARDYARSANGLARVHFTVAPNLRNKFQVFLTDVRRRYDRSGDRFDVSLSVQNASTDTIAVDDDNEPVRKPDGKLHMRPGGHGALLENLERLGGDIVLIKNVDNVVPDARRPAANRFKPILTGLLIELQSQLFKYLDDLSSEPALSDARINEMLEFAERELSVPRAKLDDFRASSFETRREYLRWRFDRPLRVCGVVRRTGDPGGGPFWTEDEEFVLQIVESAQVKLEDPRQREIWQTSTHFNPVDIVCGMRNHRGSHFSLRDYRDQDSAFITRKFMRGQGIKVLELPGLWNGAMAMWNTVFVEVPLETFNPVKTVLDLLCEAQP
jgi:mannose-6-phosphate isomerase class I